MLVCRPLPTLELPVPSCCCSQHSLNLFLKASLPPFHDLSFSPCVPEPNIKQKGSHTNNSMIKSLRSLVIMDDDFQPIHTDTPMS